MALTKQRKQLLALAALVVIAATVWYAYFGRVKGVSKGVTFHADSYTPINAQDFSIIFKQRGDAQKTAYKPSGRNPFVASAVPVVTPVMASKAAEKPRWPDYTVPQEVIVPPQLPWKFFGYGNLPSNGGREAFLLEGEDVHIVGEGEVVLNHIRIVHIGNEKIEYEDTNTGARNSNQLEAVPGPSA
ncbi:MAG: hypothetical protein WAN12_10430 [Candidatus Acidiferrum sp.]